MADPNGLLRYLATNVHGGALPHTTELLAERLLADPSFVDLAEGLVADMIDEAFIGRAFPMAAFDPLLAPFVTEAVKLAVKELERDGMPTWAAIALVGALTLGMILLANRSQRS